MIVLTGIAALVAGANDASAKSSRKRPRPPVKQEATQPIPAYVPKQIFATKGVQPLTPEQEQSLNAKDSFKECIDCPEMVVVPKGTFMMGTPEDEPYRLKGEDPVHRVTIARPF